jgi:hypothetical protein
VKGVESGDVGLHLGDTRWGGTRSPEQYVEAGAPKLKESGGEAAPDGDGGGLISGREMRRWGRIGRRARLPATAASIDGTIASQRPLWILSWASFFLVRGQRKRVPGPLRGST